MVENWIYDENLRLFMELLAHFADASFDNDDWIGLEYALLLRPENLDRERHVEWPLSEARLDLAYELGASVVSFTLEASHDLELRADTLAIVMQSTVVHRS